jgi:hypothetical protein
MASSSYHFITNWQVEATCADVYNTLKEANDLARWWPSVYLDVAPREKGDAEGRGKVVELFTKGWLPYSLTWRFRVTDVDPKNHSGFALDAFGDLAGRGVWRFEQQGKMCHITYDWRISAEKPILKYLSFLLKPIFAANHHWAMNKGLESLKLELRRRRGEQNVPLPPQATFPHNVLNNKILQSNFAL